MFRNMPTGFEKEQSSPKRSQEMEPATQQDRKEADWMHSLVKWIFSYNRYTTVGVVLFIMLIYLGGCRLTAPSPISGESKTVEELSAEYNAWLREKELLYQSNEKQIEAHLQAIQALQNANDQIATSVESVNADLDSAIKAIEAKRAQQSKFINDVFNTAVTTFPQIAPASPFVALATTALFGGALLDNRRKSKIIKKLSEGQASNSVS